MNEICPVILDNKQCVYKCANPKWIEEKEYYNISQIIIGYFENILNIKFILSKKKKNDINDVFKNFFNKKHIVLDLIKHSKYNENLYDMIDLKKIISDIINDRILINDEERRIASKKFLLGIYQNFRMFEPPVEYNLNNIFYKYKEILMEKSETMLNHLIFIPLEGESIIDKHIKEKIYDELYLYADKKRIEDVLTEISEKGFLSNNNKKKTKKKKKKNKKNEKENEIENDKLKEDNKINDNNNSINNNNLNIINTQDIGDINEKSIKLKKKIMKIYMI